VKVDIERAETEEYYVESKNAENIALTTLKTIITRLTSWLHGRISRSSMYENRKLTTTTLDTRTISKNKPAGSKKIALDFDNNKQI
jgi:hypothetical protein